MFGEAKGAKVGAGKWSGMGANKKGAKDVGKLEIVEEMKKLPGLRYDT